MTNPLIAFDDRIAPLEDQLITLKRSRNELLPISRIPTEILVKIFLIASTGFWDEDLVPISGPPKPFRRGPILLSHVSWIWRKTALNTPEIWAYICIVETTTSRLAQHFLKRSYPLPITVVIRHHPSWQQFSGLSVKPRAFNVITHLLNNGVPRLRHLVISLANPTPLIISVRRTLPCVSSLETLRISSQHRLPLLEELTLDVTETTNLRTLSILPCFLPWTSPVLSNSPRLTELVLLTPPRATLSQLHRILSNVPELEDLHLYQIPHAAVDGTEVDLPRILLPKLHKVKLSGGQNAIVGVLRLLRLPPTTTTHFIFKILPRPGPVDLPSTGVHETRRSMQEILGALNDAHVSGFIGRENDLSNLIAPAVIRFRGPYSVDDHAPIYAIEADELSIPGRGCTTDISLKMTDIFNPDPNNPSLLLGMKQHFPFTFSYSDGGWSSYGWSLSRLREIVSDLELPSEFWDVASTLPTLKTILVKANQTKDIIRLLGEGGRDSSGLGGGGNEKIVHFSRLELLGIQVMDIGSDYVVFPLEHPDGIKQNNDLALAVATALGSRRSYIQHGTKNGDLADVCVPGCTVWFTKCLGPLQPTTAAMLSDVCSEMHWVLAPDPEAIQPSPRVNDPSYDSEDDGIASIL